MPSGGRAIVIGGGISDVAPFTIGQIPMVVSASPPSVSDSILRQVAGPPAALIVGAVDPSPAAAETFRTEGGIISDQAGSTDAIRLGRGASAAGGVAIAIGTNSVTDSAGNIAFGNLASATSAGCMAFGNGAVALGNVSMAIGASASANGTGGAGGALAIGNGTSVIGVGGTCVGHSSLARANSIAFGFGALANAPGSLAFGVGANVNVAHTNAMVFGASGASAGIGTCVIGSNLSLQGIEEVIIGRGNTASNADDLRIRPSNSSGANGAGADFVLQAGRGTGTGIPGEVWFETSTAIGAGATLQTATLRARVDDKLSIEQNEGIRFRNQTTGAGAGAGTLTNAPTAGDPAFWLRVLIDVGAGAGTSMFIPCWT